MNIEKTDLFMKTTDGKELRRYDYYYTRAGQVVILDDWAMGQKSPVFLVSRFYEGEAMEAKLYPGGHTEVTCQYEHQGEIEAVNELFKDVPIFVVDELYKQRSKEVLTLCASIGLLENVIKTSKKKSKELDVANKELGVLINNKEIESSNLIEKIESLKEEIIEKTGQISTAEDRLGELVQSGETAVITQDELEALRKAQFKLECLAAGGVDNWEWYDESLESYRKRYP